MKIPDISTAKDPDLRASLAALKRAGDLARKTAILTDTHIIIEREGRVVRISAAELKQAEREGSQL